MRSCTLCFVSLLPASILNAADDFRSMEKSFFSAQHRGDPIDFGKLKQFAIMLIEGLQVDVSKRNKLGKESFESYLGGDEDEFDEKGFLDGEIARMSGDLLAVQKAFIDETYRKIIDSVIQATGREFSEACSKALQELKEK